MTHFKYSLFDKQMTLYYVKYVNMQESVMSENTKELKEALILLDTIASKIHDSYNIELLKRAKTSVDVLEIVKRFINECCLLGPHESVKIGELHQALVKYCLANGFLCPNINQLSRDMKNFGCTSCCVRQSRGLRGISLKTNYIITTC